MECWTRETCAGVLGEQHNLKLIYLCTMQKATIHQVTTLLATTKNVLFPGHNYLLTTGTDDSSLAGTRAIIKALSYQHWWLEGGYDLEIWHF